MPRKSINCYRQEVVVIKLFTMNLTFLPALPGFSRFTSRYQKGEHIASGIVLEIFIDQMLLNKSPKKRVFLIYTLLLQPSREENQFYKFSNRLLKIESLRTGTST